MIFLIPFSFILHWSGHTVSNAWEKLGGGQADIYYPDVFEGCWEVGSTLVGVETPKGIEYTNDAVSSSDPNQITVYHII